MVQGSLVLVDLATNKNDYQRLLKVEVVDPTEADRRRALDEVKMQSTEEEGSLNGTKGAFSGSRFHSSRGNRKTRTVKRKTPKQSASARIKRAKDKLVNVYNDNLK